MFKKYNNMPAAVAIGIYLLGALFYAVQTIFWADYFLATHEIDIAAIPLTRALGGAYLGFAVGLILTFVNGPDGQKTFFIVLLTAQVVTLAILWHGHLMGNFDNLLQDAIVASVLTVLLAVGYFRLQPRL